MDTSWSNTEDELYGAVCSECGEPYINGCDGICDNCLDKEDEEEE